MKKKRATRNFIILGILLLFCFIFSFVSFRIPTTVDNFVGFYNGIYGGIDVSGGVTATYVVEHYDDFEGDTSVAVDKAMDRVEGMLRREYNEYFVEKVGEDKIRVTIPKLTDSTTITSNYLVNYITFATEEIKDAEAYKPTFTGANITSASYFSANGTFGTLIKFDDEGKEALKAMAEKSPSTLYIYQDKDYTSVLLRISVDKDSLTQIADSNQLFISDKSLFPGRDEAEIFADKVASGMIGVDMELDGEVSMIPPALGENAGLSIGLILLACLLASFAFLVIKYRELAFATIMSLLTFVAMSLIIMPIFTAIQVSLAGVVGIIAIYLITFIAHIIYLEKARKDFAKGKKLLASFKSSYVKSVLANVDMYVVILLTAIASLFVAIGAIKTVAIIVAILTIPSMLSSMLIHRGMVKWYLDINPTKYKRINFEKGEASDEE
ncbi:MAG: hypothetical protein E7361_04505 [Clostridiales bacterium]|nr:hypothetical protein [Clostridiales bacterium]